MLMFIIQICFGGVLEFSYWGLKHKNSRLRQWCSGGFRVVTLITYKVRLLHLLTGEWDLVQLYLASIFSKKHPLLLTVYFTNAIVSESQSTPTHSLPSLSCFHYKPITYSQMAQVPSLLFWPCKFIHGALEEENLERFCFIQALLGSKRAAAVWRDP